MTEAPLPLGPLAEIPDRIALTARADPQIMDLVHAVLGHLWADHGDVDDGDRLRFETAIMEILGNIIEHAYRVDSSSQGPGARRFELVVGGGPPPGGAPLGDTPAPRGRHARRGTQPDVDAESGRGLPMAMAALSELTYDRIEGRNVWTLVRRRAAG